ncbi:MULTISPECIES: SLC13 family permease [unclassified Nocardioides]|uniref:SLC13 family permease n=1 Tax=unclassified Nocardioides TaxID=2615069 RepID=UPI0007020D4A|nr:MULTISPECIES: SLC13 family permease [unclassified Nocardioides]KQY64276.1 hypothetical protein ASD30_04850 [Nocardioides sp. Root140]KRF16292.1 hypothetical protein ASH02_06875 [Nocardioides sp. Soil796]
MPFVVDLVGVACLVALLAVAFLHPRGRHELLAGVACAGAVLAVGAVSFAEVGDQVRTLLPVVLFLAAILVVAELCAAEGLFAAVGQRVRRAGRGSPRRLVVLTFVVASAVTAVLSLDATVVLLTPVIAAAATGTGAQRAGMHACVRLANSASLLLPVSNLTNLLALPHLDLSFTTWVLLMAPVWVVVILVEYAGVLLVFPEARRRRSSSGVVPDPAEPLRMPLVPLVTVVAMLAGFAAGSAIDVDPFWVAGAAAVVLVVHALSRRATRAIAVVHAAHLPFVVFVLCLGVVVLAVTDSFLGEAVAGLIPSSDGLVSLLLVAVLATALANLVNNLPATLLLVPLVAPLGPVAVLAALIGLDVGSGLTYPGSLANLLWRRTLRRHGSSVDTRLFHLHAAVVTPVAVLVGTTVLWAWAAGTGLA